MNDVRNVIVLTPNFENTYFGKIERIVFASIPIELALGWNFIRNQPTFAIWDGPNNLYGTIFLALGFGRAVTLNVYRRLSLVRTSMVFSACYMTVLAVGTSTPYFDSEGSLQLPILYALGVLVQLPLIREPFVNPVTAKQ